MNSTDVFVNYQQQQAPLFKTPWNTLYIALIAIIITAGVALNTVTAFLYWQRKIVHTNFHYALHYISIIGIFQLIGFIPFMALQEPYHPPSTYDFRVALMCSFSKGLTLFFGPAFANVYIISFLSVERYMVIKQPLASLKISNKTTRNAIFAFCILTCFISMPNVITFQTDQKGMCVRRNYELSLVYAALVIFLGLVVPTVVMVTAYVLTIRHLYKPSLNGQENLARMRHRKKVVRSLGVLIGVFLICWTPFSINWIASYVGVYTEDENGLTLYNRVNAAMIIPPLLVPILNNIIYGMTKQDIRSIRKSIRHR